MMISARRYTSAAGGWLAIVGNKRPGFANGFLYLYLNCKTLSENEYGQIEKCCIKWLCRHCFLHYDLKQVFKKRALLL